ncbi:MAG: RAMP superfamily CRISPR-associated protein [Bacteroidia bacterium]|nr:RAMP superfamily CRISPR-associated protein [Bacteroidia bacterium]MDW8301471.1 RAMP superfamily CRISPR-associated protein [Bacteroidia bacterium]
MKKDLVEQAYIAVDFLTPTHVGAGNEKAWDSLVQYYDQRNKKLYIYDLDAYLRKKTYEELNRITNDIINASFSPKFEDIKDCIIHEFDCPIPPEKNNPIKTLIRNGEGYPYLPGSSIKGALRSVLFNYLYKKVKVDEKKIEESLFGKIDNNLMRLIQVSDAYFLNSRIYATKLFNLKNSGGNRFEGAWKSALKRGNETKFKETGFVTHFETFSGKSVFRINIAEKVYQLLEPDTPPNANHIIQQQGSTIEFIFQIVNNYTRNFIKKEIDFFDEYQTDKTNNIRNKLQDLLKNVPNSNQSCVLRIGMGSGFHAITGDWQFENHLLESIIQSKKTEKFYKSRKIAFHPVNQDYEMRLMGFARLTIVDEQEKDSILQKLEEAKIAKQKSLKNISLLSLAEETEDKPQTEIPVQNTIVETKENTSMLNYPRQDKLKQGDKVQAIVKRREGSQVFVQLCVEGLEREFSFKYHASDLIPGAVVEVQITDYNKKQKEIQHVIFSKKLS